MQRQEQCLISEEEKLDWLRWHDLIDIKSKRIFTAEEEAEYAVFSEIAEREDAEEAARQDAILAPFIKKHEEQMAQLDKLIDILSKIRFEKRG